jgi:glutaconate CoA-transferase subunit B
MMAGYSIKELMTVVLSRNLKGKDIAATGLASQIPRAAIMLAQKTHSPDLTGIIGTLGAKYNVSNKECFLTPSSTDWRNYKWCELIEDHDKMFRYKQNKFVFFMSGIQVDQYGNTNLLGIQSAGKYLFRGPGSVALPTLSEKASEYFIYTAKHDQRTFVSKVDAVSAVGQKLDDKSRSELGIPGKGPNLVISPVAVMDFEEDSKKLKLKSVNPGVPVDYVKKNTGFELVIPNDVPKTEIPNENELKVLREIDKSGILRR